MDSFAKADYPAKQQLRLYSAGGFSDLETVGIDELGCVVVRTASKPEIGEGKRRRHERWCSLLAPTFFFFFITLGLELSDTKVYEP